MLNEVVDFLGKKNAFNTYIHRGVKLAESPEYNKPISQYDRKGRGYEDHLAFVNELIERSNGEV